jgi:hypothetical protein
MSKITGSQRSEGSVRSDSVIPRSGVQVTMPPGAKAPRSGIYEQVGPRGGRTNEQTDSTRGEPLPPTVNGNQGWRIDQPARHNDNK